MTEGITLALNNITERARAIIEPQLRSTVHRLPASIARVSAHQLGFSSGNGPGKLLRPALALLSARAVGATFATGVPGALAVQLVHEFSLLHDDIMDGDAERRHQPSGWAKFGVGAALLAGDCLLSSALRTVAHHPEALTTLSHTIDDLCIGQAKDLDHETEKQISIAEYLTMCGGKTAALMGCSAAIGAILADADKDACAGLYEFGYHLGLAFQVTDDLFGIWGDPSVTGKPTSDLAHGKKSFPVVAALTAKHPLSPELLVLLNPNDGEDMSQERVSQIRCLLEEIGALTRTNQEIEFHASQSRHVLNSLDIASEIRSELMTIVDATITRHH